jgi:hypothetical protein
MPPMGLEMRTHNGTRSLDRTFGVRPKVPLKLRRFVPLNADVVMWLSVDAGVFRELGRLAGSSWLHQPRSARTERPSGAEALVDSAGFVPGMNPRPTSQTSFSGTCEVRAIAVRFQRPEGRCSVPGSGFRFVGGWVRLWVIMRGSWAVHCIGPEVQLQVLRLR